MTLLQCHPQHNSGLRCVVVGDDAVGKTSMLIGYATSRYPTRHVPSVFDNYAGSLTVSGRFLHMQIIDTLEGERDLYHRQSVYLGADIFVVCFSVICPESLRNVEEVWIPEIRTYAPKTPFILVGSQTDLRSSPEVISALSAQDQHAVTTAEAETVARRLNAAYYIETSPEVETRIRRVINSAIASVLKVRGSSSNCSIL